MYYKTGPQVATKDVRREHTLEHRHQCWPQGKRLSFIRLTTQQTKTCYRVQFHKNLTGSGKHAKIALKVKVDYSRSLTNHFYGLPQLIIISVRYVTNQLPKANSAFHPFGVGKWVPASAGKAKACMVHSVSGWTRGVQVKLWDPLKTRAIPERLRGVFTMSLYTNPRLPLPYLLQGHTYTQRRTYEDTDATKKQRLLRSAQLGQR